MGWMGWDGRLSPSASLLRAPYGANKAEQAGYPLTEDMNGFQQEGVGRMDATIHRGQR